MATKLTAKPLSREIRIGGIDAPVIIDLDDQGIMMRVKGSRTSVFCPWLRVLGASATPTSVPSFLHGRPLEFLQRQAKKRNE